MKKSKRAVKKPFFGEIEYLHTGKTGKFHIGNFETENKCIEHCKKSYMQALRVWVGEKLIIDNTKLYTEYESIRNCNCSNRARR